MGRKHVQPAQASLLSWRDCALGVPALRGPQQGQAAGMVRCCGEEAGRERRVAGASEAERAQQMMPASPNKALSAGKLKGGQSPSVLAHQPRRRLGTAGMWNLAPTPWWVPLPPLCHVGEMHQEPSMGVPSLHPRSAP